MQSRGILEDCVNAWREAYSSIRESEWRAVIHSDIMDELGRLQMQPEIMDNYRRFVVIRSPSEARMGEYYQGVRLLYLHGELPCTDDNP